MEFVARLLGHVPDPRWHLVHEVRVYETDPLICPRCRAVMREVSFITEPRSIRRILDHLTRRATHGRVPPAAAGQIPALPRLS